MFKNLKRLNKYIKKYRKLTALSIIMVFFIQFLAFISPLIFKSILDDCVNGIEDTWTEVYALDNDSVEFDGKIYKQIKNLDDNEIHNGEYSIIMYKTSFYFTNNKVEEGRNEIKNNLLTVYTDNGNYTYNVIKLDKNQVWKFYNPVKTLVVVLCSFLFLRALLTIICSYIQRLSVDRVTTRLVRDIRLDAMEKLERLPISYFESEPAGKLTNRIIYDINGCVVLYRNLINTVLNLFLSFVLAYVGMFYLDYKLALLSFIVFPFAFLWIKLFVGKLNKIAVKVNELRSLITAKINEIINGISILQVFNFKKHTIKEFNVINDEFTKEQLKEVDLHITLGWNLLNVIRSLLTAFIVLYFGYLHLNVQGVVITAGLIVAYNEYLLKIIDPLTAIFQQISEIQHANVTTDRIFKILDAPLEKSDGGSIKRFAGNIEFKNVWFSYVDNDYVLKGIDLNIKAGQKIGLVGHTGCGKSSLMNLLLRFYDIDENHGHRGTIFIDNMDITQFDKRAYREHIGIVLQEPVLFKGTIKSNILFGKEDVSDEQIYEILKSIGGDKIVNKFEKGIYEETNRMGNNMSSGEKQIISLARVIVHNPSILIMDEATAHIDTETECMIQHALNKVSENRTVIIIAHRLSTIKDCDKIVVLDHGLKVEEGTHDELLALNKMYANIYRSQIE